MKNVTLLWALLASLLMLSCQSDDAAPQAEYVPTNVIVGLKQGITTQQLINFINARGLSADYINYMKYKSALPATELEYAREYFNNQPFMSPNWGVYAYIDPQDNVMRLLPHLSAMHLPACQSALMQTIETLQLADEPTETAPVILFTVPAGKEMEWRTRFLEMEEVAWADLNWYAEIIID